MSAVSSSLNDRACVEGRDGWHFRLIFTLKEVISNRQSYNSEQRHDPSRRRLWTISCGLFFRRKNSYGVHWSWEFLNFFAQFKSWLFDIYQIMNMFSFSFSTAIFLLIFVTFESYLYTKVTKQTFIDKRLRLSIVNNINYGLSEWVVLIDFKWISKVFTAVEKSFYQ